MNRVIVVPEHVDLMPSEDGQLTKTCKGNNIYKLRITLDGVNNHYIIYCM
jgi:hypothetical protein